MVDLKKNSWKLVAIAGLLVILSIIIPSFIYVNVESNMAAMVWLLGNYVVVTDGEVGESDMLSEDFTPIGSMFFTILLIIGILLVLIAIMTMKGKDVPHKGLLLKIFGALLIIMPLLLRTVLTLATPSGSDPLTEVFGYTYNSIILFLPIAGTLILVPEILNKTGGA